MNEIHERMIAEAAKQIRASVADGRLYGEPIDKDNINHVLVATYWMGKKEELERHMVDWETYNKLFVTD